MRIIALLLLPILLGGCETTRTITRNTLYVLDTPRRVIRATLVREEPRATTSTTTIHDADYVPPTPPDPTVTEVPPPPPRRSAPPPPTAPQFPYGKPVPGKPGYVFSPYSPNEGYVDVTGYRSGSKVKDPYSGKIFLVP